MLILKSSLTTCPFFLYFSVGQGCWKFHEWSEGLEKSTWDAVMYLQEHYIAARVFNFLLDSWNALGYRQVGGDVGASCKWDGSVDAFLFSIRYLNKVTYTTQKYPKIIKTISYSRNTNRCFAWRLQSPLVLATSAKQSSSWVTFAHVTLET